jgi:NADPH:quinone reductase
MGQGRVFTQWARVRHRFDAAALVTVPYNRVDANEGGKIVFGIRVERHGGPEVLEWVTLGDPVPGPRDLVVDLSFAGLNYVDVYQRSGLYPMELPFIPGSEGAGVVRAVGAEVTRFAVGDRVAWSSVLGSYAEQVLVPEASAVVVPDNTDFDVAAAVVLQGMTAHYLALDTFPLVAGNRCLIHAGAGGVGLLLIQIAKRCGAEVFTTVGSEEKVELAKEAGADHVIRYDDTDFGAAVEQIAGDRPLDVVYDGVGQAVFARSLELLRRRGTMVTFGNASGPVEPMSPLVLTRNGSLYLTRPTLFDYVATRDDLERRASDLFTWIAAGSLRVRIGARVALAEAAEAHRMIESRSTTGKTLLYR